MSSKKIICITGTDGSGKSTLIHNLKNSFPTSMEATIWDAMFDSAEAVFSDKKKVDQYICSLDADSRLLFLAHAILFSVNKALRSDKEIIFLNAYYYKYFSSEMASCASKDLVASLISIFPKPDLIFYLDAPLDVRAERKEFFSKYECGGTKPNKENFIAFQNKTNPLFNDFIESDWIRLDTTQSKEELTAKCIEIIGK